MKRFADYWYTKYLRMKKNKESSYAYGYQTNIPRFTLRRAQFLKTLNILNRYIFFKLMNIANRWYIRKVDNRWPLTLASTKLFHSNKKRNKNKRWQAICCISQLFKWTQSAAFLSFEGIKTGRKF